MLVDTVSAQNDERPCAAPSQPSASARALASRSPYTGKLEHLAQVLAEGERPPGRDAHRRHGHALALDGSGATDPDRRDHDTVVFLDLLELLAHDPDERREVRLRTDIALDGHERAVEQFASEGHQPGRELRAADVDGEDHVTGWVHGARTISPSRSRSSRGLPM